VETAAMSKAVDDIINSILEEYKTSGISREELDKKTLFRLLNYCPPPGANLPLLQKPSPRNWAIDGFAD
jgi:hypothetical protein